MHMAMCPVCQAKIEEDFGLITCSSCGSQVFLEFNDSEPAGSTTTIDIESSKTELMSVTDSEEKPLVAEFENKIFNEPESAPSEEFNLPSTLSDSNMSDVAAYGNSDISSAQDGAFRYELCLRGIDTSDIRSMVKEILDDEKFLWDADLLLANIQRGELRLNELTAVKAALLVQRLRSLPIEISWEQHAIINN